MRTSTPVVRPAADTLELLAAGIHDGPLQVLYAAGLGLQHAEAVVADRPEAAGSIAEARAALQAAVDELRGLLRALKADDVASGLHAVCHTVGGAVACTVDDDAADRLDPAHGVELVIAASTVAAQQRRRAGGAPLSISLVTGEDGDVVLELTGTGIGAPDVVADLERRAYRVQGTLSAGPDRLALRVPA